MDNKNRIKQLILLEEHFMDQLDFKIQAIFGLMEILDYNKREIESFMDMLDGLTKQNIELLTREL